MGVRRAMAMVLAEANKKNGELFTYGPLIHNNQVLDLLASKGVKSVDNPVGLTEGKIIIRAHGIPPQKRREIKKTGLKIIDATCPKVARVQGIIRSYTGKGYSVIIVGDKGHPEVKGLIGYSRTSAHVIKDTEDISALPHLESLFVVAQTTQNKQNFHEVVEALKAMYPEILVFDTICDATKTRQDEIRAFNGQVDALVVVGGYHSGNTQRLVQISKEEGLPTFHVETEKDLDEERLAEMGCIGVAAGASTPNWMIKNVVRKIESIRGKREALIFRLLNQGFKFLVSSNIVAALGAFCFAYAASILSNSRPDITIPTLSFLYIYAMHVLNRLLDKGAGAYNDPERAAFIRKYRSLLITTGIASTAAAMCLSLSVGLTTFLALAMLSLMGIIYSIPIIPERIRQRWRYSKIKDIPGSRSLSEALAWVAVISILPLLNTDHIIRPAAIVSATVVFLMSYVRSVLFDFFQVQGDLIVGTETLPIVLGKQKTLSLLRAILIICTLILCLAPILGINSPFSYVMLIPLSALFLCLMAYEKRWIYPSITFEALVDGNFFLAGLSALIWQVF